MRKQLLDHLGGGHDGHRLRSLAPQDWTAVAIAPLKPLLEVHALLHGDHLIRDDEAKQRKEPTT